MTGPATAGRVGSSRWRVTDAALLGAFTFYVLGAAYVLGQGLLAVVASAVPDLHEALHEHHFVGGTFARTAERIADGSHDVASGPRIAIDFLVSAVNLTIAGVVLWLRPRDRSARVLALALVGAAGIFNLTSQATLEVLPLTSTEVAFQGAAHVVAGLAYVYALVLFPDGRAVPHWSLPRLALLYVPLTGVAGFLALRAGGAARPGVLLLYFGLAVPITGVAGQAYRLRRAGDPTSHAQARLLFWSLLPALAIGVWFLATQEVAATSTTLAGRHVPNPPVVLYRVFQIAFLTIPLALFLGLVRYRLWDIERLVNRTVVYALATAVLGAAYGAFVVVVQLTVGRVSGSAILDSKITVAALTLLLASAFRPVRDRVQRAVDRRFNRARYDAVRIVEDFSTRLLGCVEIESVLAEVQSVLVDVVGPSQVALWLPAESRAR